VRDLPSSIPSFWVAVAAGNVTTRSVIVSENGE
jgi:hypothetical protein